MQLFPALLYQQLWPSLVWTPNVEAMYSFAISDMWISMPKLISKLWCYGQARAWYPFLMAKLAIFTYFRSNFKVNKPKAQLTHPQRGGRKRPKHLSIPCTHSFFTKLRWPFISPIKQKLGYYYYREMWRLACSIQTYNILPPTSPGGCAQPNVRLTYSNLREKFCWMPQYKSGKKRNLHFVKAKRVYRMNVNKYLSICVGIRQRSKSDAIFVRERSQCLSAQWNLINWSFCLFSDEPKQRKGHPPPAKRWTPPRRPLRCFRVRWSVRR